MLDRTDGRQTIWNEATVLDLRRLWGLGETAKQIAEQIPGTTRNSVLGKAHRLDLPVRVNITLRTPRPPQGQRSPPQIRFAREPKPERAPPRASTIRRKAKPPEFLGIALLDLDQRACRYPQGERSYLFCGQPAEPTSSYCSYHAGKCFRLQEG